MATGLMTHAQGRDHRGIDMATRVVPREELFALPAPAALGRFHKPVPHGDLVNAIERIASENHYDVVKEEFSLSKNGQRLFGVVDLYGGRTLEGMSRQIGFRNATDQTMAIRAVAGLKVFVCDNMALSGDEFAFAHKNTSNLNVIDLVRNGFGRWSQQMTVFEQRVETLQDAPLTMIEAKALIYDAVINGALPKALMDTVGEMYFAAEPTEDCAPRTMWGLHNAFTRTLKQIKNPQSRYQRTIDVGHEFGI